MRKVVLNSLHMDSMLVLLLSLSPLLYLVIGQITTNVPASSVQSVDDDDDDDDDERVPKTMAHNQRRKGRGISE